LDTPLIMTTGLAHLIIVESFVLVSPLFSPKLMHAL
jgi:hypothetical protein